MLFRFKSKACADLIMLQADGQRILKAMIGDDPVRGIVQVKDLPAALTRLQAAVADDQAQANEAALAGVEETDAVQDEDGGRSRIRLAQRAVPMQTMLQRCIDEKADLVWGV